MLVESIPPIIGDNLSLFLTVMIDRTNYPRPFSSKSKTDCAGFFLCPLEVPDLICFTNIVSLMYSADFPACLIPGILHKPVVPLMVILVLVVPLGLWQSP
ncbi:hypothetical protein CW304_21735 [Bacillus sp. UFRGS-B20]|nr:hypothetical protein CW304_21735 [Bacillus sp. UFRGS-B20]